MKEKWKQMGKMQRMQTLGLLWLLLGMVSLLVVSSFAWFSISPTPRVSDMGLYVNSPVGLELATDYSLPDELWGQIISFPDLVSESAPLKPVTWSDAEQCFKAIRYGQDGRQSNKLRALNDADNANQIGDNQYYIMGTFYAKTDSKCTVSLAEAVELNNGEHGAGTYVIGMPIWNASKGLHEDGGSGAQYAARVGFRITKIDRSTGELLGESVFCVYEPNADMHLSGSEYVVDTRSSDGTETLVSRHRLLVQSTSTWTESDPVERDVTIKTMGTFLTGTDLFVLDQDEVAQIVMYIWIEGQDVDCYGLPEDAGLFANIQFSADYETQSGIEEIPEEEPEIDPDFDE